MVRLQLQDWRKSNLLDDRSFDDELVQGLLDGRLAVFLRRQKLFRVNSSETDFGKVIVPALSAREDEKAPRLMFKRQNPELKIDV